MEHKDITAFLQCIDTSFDWEQPKIVLVSGMDMELGDVVIKHIKRQLVKQIGSYESLTFSAQPKEGLHLQTELANTPLFSPYRFLLVRQGEEILQSLFSSTNQNQKFIATLKQLPERSLLLILYAGNPPRQLIDPLKKQDKLLHLNTRKLYAHQIEGNLRNAIHKRKLILSQDGFYLLMENLAAKSGMIEKLLDHLQSRTNPKTEITKEDVRSILFPSQGWNPFDLVDAFFSGRLKAILSEYKRFHGSKDNFFVVLKLILQRLKEIRLSSLAYSQQMTEKEMISFIGIGTKHPFIQKKILERLRKEVPYYNTKKQLEIHNFIISMQKNLRYQIPLAKQAFFFQEESLRVFLRPFKEAKLN